ncbi:autotransporter-associated beta strand repeat-containing protein, partial [uncultured Thiodictyon sp.]|uniref:autotransporter-associated beta strand repeat-containing protein n=1 Tax=uncultured Thiodictyon sp. TaxID=1846217 RepID=UPI0025D3BE98
MPLTERKFSALLLFPLLTVPHLGYAQTFVAQGPAPSTGPNVTVQSADLPSNQGSVAGAVGPIAVAADGKTMYIGAPNGGIWKTNDGGRSWTALSDNQASLSISSLAIDPSNSDILVAGTGLTSNGSVASGVAGRGGQANGGLLYSIDGGVTWKSATLGDGKSLMNISAVAVSGQTILAGTLDSNVLHGTQPTGSGYGLYRSIDGGAKFDPIAGANPPPAGQVTDLVADRNSPSTYYVAISNDTTYSVYKTIDGGSNWTDTNLNQLTLKKGAIVKLAAGPGGSVAALVVSVDNQQAQAIYLLDSSVPASLTWTQLKPSGFDPAQMLTPIDAANGVPNTQGLINTAIAIDPKDKTIVYVSGVLTINALFYPTPVYRITATSYQSLIGVYTSNGSAVHADSRAMAFDANGNLIMSGDGGIYVRANPQSTDGAWTSLSGDLSLFASYKVGYDANSHRVVTANQDTGVALQSQPNSLSYNAIQGGDGVNAAVNDRTLVKQSAIYSSSQEMGSLWRTIIDAQGNAVGNSAVILELSTDPKAKLTYAFSSPFVLNYQDKQLIAIGAIDALSNNHVYVTKDTLDVSKTSITLSLTDRGSVGSEAVSSISYGISNNSTPILVGTNQGLWLNTTNDAAQIKKLDYPGYAPTAIVFDPRSADRFYATDYTSLYGTLNQKDFTKLSDTWPTALSTFTNTAALEFISYNGVNALLVGGVNTKANLPEAPVGPLVVADSNSLGVLSDWRYFGTGLPNSLVSALNYNPTVDVLAVGTFGRGIYLLYDVTSNFKAATRLEFGRADNDSRPDAALLLTNGNYPSRPLDKFGTGTLTISGIASYSGATTIESGTLALTGAGSIASSSGVDVKDSGTFNISGTTNGATITSLSGSGMVALGAQSLTFSEATDTFYGVIEGAGNLALNGGSQALAGVNTYTGQTLINGGTLALTGTGSIASSSGVTDNGIFDISGTTSGATIANLSGTGAVALGAQSLTFSGANGTFAGTIDGAGGLIFNGGYQVLSGLNTYAGQTLINGGLQIGAGGTTGTLGTGGVVNNSLLVFNRSNALTVPNAISGTGAVTQSGTGTTTLTANNTYSGPTTISNGTLALAGVGSIASSSGVWDYGTFDISGTANGATITGLFGNG